MMQAAGAMVGQRLGDYELRQLIGIGGMAEVYRGYDVVLQREVAVKVLAGSLASDHSYVERFRTEARRVAALNHPNVVPVYAAGEERGSLYLVMPILSDSLRDLLDRERRVPFAEAVALATQVASGLDAAHAIGLVHRDVKPENVLVDADGKALLTDFGIAREMAPRGSGSAATLSATGLPVGTPEYMAPEQLRGEPLDARTDVYALGMVLYELLTGVLPFVGGTPYDVAVKVITAPLPPPSSHNPSIPPDLERAVLRALARNPAERFPSAADFAMALRRAVSNQGAAATAIVGAAPGHDAPRAADAAAPLHAALAAFSGSLARLKAAFGRPRRARVALAGALAVLLLAGTVGGVLLAARHTPDGGTAGRTGRASPSTGATATATTAPTATPTTAPPSLKISPMPVLLTPDGQGHKFCTATQTVTNTTPRTLRWRWQAPAAPGYQFTVNNGSEMSWPADWSPGIAPGAADTIVVTAECRGTSARTVTVVDDLGHEYSFELAVSSSAAPTATPTQPPD